ncbi:MAG: hypothetical protein JST00_39740 [Deltaproteobacteria bacterium]|nr:hypothetical protein [Deltaproteobacteria bacterium]
MRRQILIELGVVFALFVIAGFVWFQPATLFLLKRDATTAIGDGTDSITIPWQYRVIVDTFWSSPGRLAFPGIYSDQVTAPEGHALFVPYSERALVLFFAPLMRTDLMPTAVVWAYVVLSGVAMYACGRLLGWQRTIALAIALAWAICPFTRARAVVHNAMVGVFFAPMVIAGLRVVAGSPRKLGWSARMDLVVGSLLFLGAVTAAHYYLLMLVGFSPALIALYLSLLPRGAEKLRAVGRLFVAALPSLALLLWTRVMPMAPADARRVAEAPQNAAEVAKEADKFLHWYAARAEHFVAGDVRFGDRDWNPWRRAVTRRILAHTNNAHEQTNGIRWIVLGSAGALALAMTQRRLRRKLTADERKLATYALLTGGAAFLLSFAPDGLRYYDTEIGPSKYFAKVFPQFRVANRMGLLVHFGALLCTGVLVSALVRRRSSRSRATLGGALLAVVALEYLPLHPVVMTAIPRAWADLPPKDGPCGTGMQVPYASWEADESRYYRAQTELRGTSCKLLHGGYLTRQDDLLRGSFSQSAYTPEDRARSVAFARCAGLSWVQFGPETPEDFKRSYCADLGWAFVRPDACRAPVASIAPARNALECLPPRVP